MAGKLTSGIAHEVGTPLNIISGRAEILLRSLPADHPGRPDLEVIVGQIDRISGIIRSLLDTVRQQKPEIQPVPIPPLLQRLVPLLDHMARRRGVTIATKACGAPARRGRRSESGAAGAHQSPDERARGHPARRAHLRGGLGVSQ